MGKKSRKNGSGNSQEQQDEYDDFFQSADPKSRNKRRDRRKRKNKLDNFRNSQSEDYDDEVEYYDEDDYKEYMAARMAGTIDAYGNIIGGGDGDGSIVVELSQSLSAGTVLTFLDIFKTINFVGNIVINCYPDANRTIYLDLDRLITVGEDS